MSLVNSFTAPVAKTPAGAVALMNLDNSGRLITTNSGITPVYNVTAATVIKALPGYVVTIAVIVAGSAVGTVNDCATTGAAAVGNQVAVAPNTVGVIQLDWPCATGIVVVPGTGQTLAVAYA